MSNNLAICKNCKHDHHSHLWANMRNPTVFIGRCNEGEIPYGEVGGGIRCTCTDYREMNNLELIEYTDLLQYATKPL